VTGRRRSLVRAAVAFAAMEPVAYGAHRWLMHGPGWGWHASHHRRRTEPFERNDLYPVTFAAGTVSAMALGTAVPRLRWLRDVGAGITAYGAAYAFVHDVHVHERVAALRIRSRRLDRLAEAHALHHRFGGEPYGMLVPVLPRALRARAAGTPTPARHDGVAAVAPRSTPPAVRGAGAGSAG
jgi:beta-carotene 3-hydroxylase